jgi:hypothetical protein
MERGHVEELHGREGNTHMHELDSAGSVHGKMVHEHVGLLKVENFLTSHVTIFSSKPWLLPLVYGLLNAMDFHSNPEQTHTINVSSKYKRSLKLVSPTNGNFLRMIRCAGSHRTVTHIAILKSVYANS